MEAVTERKPVEDTFESWVDKQIREATERGEFEGLRGAGKPIPGAGSPVDEHWWIRDYLRREGVPTDGLLPDSLLLRRDREHLGEQVADCDTEAEVRAEVAALNQRIVAWIRTPTPPLVPLALADADEVVAHWRADRAGSAAAADGRARCEAGPVAGVGGEIRTGAQVGVAAAAADRTETVGGNGDRWWRALLRVFRRR